MPLPGALLDSDDDDAVPSAVAPVSHNVTAIGGRSGQTYNDEPASQQYIGHGRLLSSMQASDNPASSDETLRNVRARSEASSMSLPVSASTPMALSRTPSTGWGVGLVAVTPAAAAATPTVAAAAASPITKSEAAISPLLSPKAVHQPSHVNILPLSRTGSSDSSEGEGGEAMSQGGQGLSKGILADRIESVQREIDQINAEIQQLQQDMERNPSPPPVLPSCSHAPKQSTPPAASASAAILKPVAPALSVPSPSPPSPRQFSVRAVINSDLVHKIYSENQAYRARAYCDIDAMLGLPNRAVLTSTTHVFDPYSLGMACGDTVLYTHVQESPCFSANARRFAQIKHLVVEKVREAQQKRQKLIHKAVRLERRLREAAVSAGLYEAPAVEITDASIRTPRLRREVTAISSDSLTPRTASAAVVERSERRVSRNACAVIPPMLTEQEKRAVAFDNRNTIDPDPLLTLQIRKIANAWSDEEHAAFFERFAAHDKQFHKIAEFLVNKSCNDVVEFYYKNKNRTAFKHRLKLINRLKERSLPFLRYGSHDAMLSNLRDGAVTTYVATRPGADAFIWMRQRQAQEQEAARVEAELGRLVRLLTARKEEKIRASNPSSAAPKNERAKSSAKASKDKDKKDGGVTSVKEARVNVGKAKAAPKDNAAIKKEQAAVESSQELGLSSKDVNASLHTDDRVNSYDAAAGAVAAASGVSVATDGPEPVALDSCRKVSKNRSVGWSQEEESAFVEFLQAHGKDWRKISSLMPGKSQVALRQQFKKMSELGQLPENLVKSERGGAAGGTLLTNPTKSAKAQARRMQQLTVSATASELVEAGTEHFALRDLSQVDSQQLGHLFMMHMMQQLQNSQGSDADRAQLAQIVNTLQEHRSQTFLQLIHEAAQLLVNQQAEAAAAAEAEADAPAAGNDDDAADEEGEVEGEGDGGCEPDDDMKEVANDDDMKEVANDDDMKEVANDDDMKEVALVQAQLDDAQTDSGVAVVVNSDLNRSCSVAVEDNVLEGDAHNSTGSGGCEMLDASSTNMQEEAQLQAVVDSCRAATSDSMSSVFVANDVEMREGDAQARAEVVFNEDHDAIDAALERKGEVGDVNTSDTHALSFSE